MENKINIHRNDGSVDEIECPNCKIFVDSSQEGFFVNLVDFY